METQSRYSDCGKSANVAGRGIGAAQWERYENVQPDWLRRACRQWVPDIYTTWEQEGYANPQVEEIFGGGQPNRTIVTLPLVGKEQDSSGEKLKKSPEKPPEKSPNKQEEIEERAKTLLQLIRDNPKISRSAMALRLNISESQVRTAMDVLKSKNLIHREGSDKEGRWIID